MIPQLSGNRRTILLVYFRSLSSEMDSLQRVIPHLDPTLKRTRQTEVVYELVGWSGERTRYSREDFLQYMRLTDGESFSCYLPL